MVDIIVNSCMSTKCSQLMMHESVICVLLVLKFCPHVLIPKQCKILQQKLIGSTKLNLSYIANPAGLNLT